MPGDHSTHLTREQILSALERLSHELGNRGIVGEVCLFGGAVMVLAYNARPATKDVDALFEPANHIRGLAATIASETGLPSDWLNDGVKGFLSANHRVEQGHLPQFDHLRLLMPRPEYLLAMKCLASRIGAGAGEADDSGDIAFLMRKLQLRTPEAVFDVIAAYYPRERIPIRAKFLVESLFEEKRA